MNIPDYFEFFNKIKISSGAAALENIPFELECMNSSRPLVITDKKSVNKGLVKDLITSFYNSGITLGAVFDELPLYVTISLLGDLSELFTVAGCDSIIALGGEAAASAAKGLNLLISGKTGNLPENADLRNSAPLKPFIYIPSSAAAGTETSNEAEVDSVIHKSDSLYPDLVIIDNRMLKRGEKTDIASSALFAITQSIEACSSDLSDPVNDSFAYASIELIYENLAGALKSHFNKKEMIALANGVMISGIVYSNSDEGIARAIGYEMGRLTGNPAGLCAGLVLPYALDYRLRSGDAGIKGELLLPLAGIDNYCSVSQNERAEKFVDLTYLMIDNLDGIIPVRIKDLGIREPMLKKIAAAAESHGINRFGKASALKILQHAYECKSFRGEE